MSTLLRSRARDRLIRKGGNKKRRDYLRSTVLSPPARARLHGAGELRHTTNSAPTGRIFSCTGNWVCAACLTDGSGVNREIHAPFYERVEVQLLRPTRPGRSATKKAAHPGGSSIVPRRTIAALAHSSAANVHLELRRPRVFEERRPVSAVSSVSCSVASVIAANWRPCSTCWDTKC